MSLFGTPQPAQTGGGLFGSAANSTAQKPAGGLFGSSTGTGTQPTGGLFGGTQNQQQSTAPTGGGLFGSSTTNQTQQPQQSGGLFGSSTAQKPAGGGLFGMGQSTQQSQQQPQQQQTGGAIWIDYNAEARGKSFWPRTIDSTATTSATAVRRFVRWIGSTTTTAISAGATASAVAIRSDYHGHTSSPATAITVVQSVVSWPCYYRSGMLQAVHLHSGHTSTITSAKKNAPFYQPTPEDDETKWEEALRNRTNPGYVPVLVKGFWELGKRAQRQKDFLSMMQTRLHEINNCLTDMLSRHDLKLSVKIADCRRKHMVLSKRCLALAAKTQVLRNRGYAMDDAEEELKKKLSQLERSVFDPSLSGRAEEIWARMLAIHEHGKRLQADMERVGAHVGSNADDEIDENTMKTAKKILDDYHAQIQHLQKELESIKKEFDEAQKMNGN
ncbi:hypothetical protein N7450_008832 [Penicillium hetheringtonii]|uniref:Nucleoporin Nup54 alpha-helical domain-containing protein n=1 Tax=Penicillium hetheringtonii TaxID=911720 RepID=A0AAD6GQQ2_9EURO|nr:hypothetical protein N7450_008832 [Penicillium hetheringtonii]